uniref:Uncharacterized protein n=1 Tax=Triticum urartu TaxID=4572 RepID=A0A8R7TFR3_TRIUA
MATSYCVSGPPPCYITALILLSGCMQDGFQQLTSYGTHRQASRQIEQVARYWLDYPHRLGGPGRRGAAGPGCLLHPPAEAEAQGSSCDPSARATPGRDSGRPHRRKRRRATPGRRSGRPHRRKRRRATPGRRSGRPHRRERCRATPGRRSSRPHRRERRRATLGRHSGRPHGRKQRRRRGSRSPSHRLSDVYPPVRQRAVQVGTRKAELRARLPWAVHQAVGRRQPGLPSLQHNPHPASWEDARRRQGSKAPVLIQPSREVGHHQG